jgi:hypothetical protein
METVMSRKKSASSYTVETNNRVEEVSYSLMFGLDYPQESLRGELAHLYIDHHDEVGELAYLSHDSDGPVYMTTSYPCLVYTKFGRAGRTFGGSDSCPAMGNVNLDKMVPVKVEDVTEITRAPDLSRIETVRRRVITPVDLSGILYFEDGTAFTIPFTARSRYSNGRVEWFEKATMNGYLVQTDLSVDKLAEQISQPVFFGRRMFTLYGVALPPDGLRETSLGSGSVVLIGRVGEGI